MYKLGLNHSAVYHHQVIYGLDYKPTSIYNRGFIITTHLFELKLEF